MWQGGLVFLIVVIECTYGQGSLTDFRTTFGGHPNVDSFYQLPKNVQEAHSLGFKNIPYRSDRGYALTLKCSNNDFRVCLLFGSSGSVAGMQHAVPREDIDNTPYDLASRLKLKSYEGKDYWTATIYYESPKTIRGGGRKGQITETIEGLWVENGNELINIPLSEEELVQKASFVKQNCFPGMGSHFYYKLSPEMDCKDMFPYFVLVKEGKVIGIGLGLNGKINDHTQKWYESYPAEAIKKTMPAAPECLSDWAYKYGILQLHTYFIEKPWAVTCEAKDNV